MYCHRGTVQNCVISSNFSIEDGGGVYCDYNGKIYNCTIVDNVSSNGAGGVYCRNYSTIMNSILWNNVNSNYNSTSYSESTNIYNCIGNWSGGGEGNITNNPSFIPFSRFKMIEFIMSSFFLLRLLLNTSG